MMAYADKLALEALIDKHGLVDLCDALAEICNGKAEHLRENWQDSDAAKIWERSAKKFDKVCS